MNKNNFILAFLLLTTVGFAYDPFVLTDKYFYAANESIFAVGSIKLNNTAVSNVSVVFTVIDQSGTTVSTNTFTTNATGQFNSTFSLATAGNYTLRANVSGDVVNHFIKVLPYADTLVTNDKPSYTSGAGGTVTVTLTDVNGAGVASQGVTASLRYQNGTIISTLSSCTTSSAGQCSINFTVPTDDGTYLIEVNNFEASIAIVVGGYDAFMKISPSILGKNQNITVKMVVKNSNGIGIAASTRQLVVTMPNGTQRTIATMTPANDSSGTALTGVYEEKLAFDDEGAYTVKVTVQPQGSNFTRELTGAFEVRAYTAEVSPWPGSTALFTPGQTVTLGVRLKNATSNEFMGTTKCGSGSCITNLASASVQDPSGVATGYALSVSEQTSLSLYRMDITVPSTAKSGAYKVQISINDSFGTGGGNGYFNIQLAKGSVRALDKPDGTVKQTFLPGKPIVLEFSATNASGAVDVTSLSSYAIKDDSGNDKTGIFGTGTKYVGNNNKSYVNLTAPKQGGRFTIRGKLTTAVGGIDAEGWLSIDVLDVELRPQAIGGGQGGGFTPFGGPGFMFAFRPNDTVTLSATIKTASEKRGHEGFMSGGLDKGGSAGGGHSVGVGGMFGIGGGTVVQGAQVTVDKILNLNTEEDVTGSTTITNCITDSTGTCSLSIQSNINGQNWTGGFHILFVNVSTSDNQSDKGQGFFEVRRYIVDVQTRAATAKNATSSGFTSFGDWFVGPDDNINISIRVIEPGTWQQSALSGNITIQGLFYGGNIGDFIFPPKFQAGSNATARLENGIAGAIINAPSGGWKSGFYILKVLANISSTIDTGESFLMVKIFQGFGDPINPTTKQQDFTTSSTENVSIRVNIFDVRNNRPAANMTVTLNKILSFENFPPSEITYTKSDVSTGKTDGNGQVIMTLPVPSGGWPSGSFLVSFDVTNGTVSDSIQGFFQVKDFFVELSGAKWRFSTNENISFNATISSDPSWMRQMFGGGCPAGDPMCASGGGMGQGGPSTSPVTVSHAFTNYGAGLDIDGDGRQDINITATPGTPNLTIANDTVAGRTAIAANFWCMTPSQCQASPTPLSTTTGFDGVDCDAGGTYSNTTTHNMSGPAVFCVRTTNGDTYKVQSESGDVNGMNIGFTKHVAGSVGGIAPPNLTGIQGFSYYNATLKSVKVIKFSFDAGETLLGQNADYNLTSATGAVVGDGKIVIPGIGSFKLVPLDSGRGGVWETGFYRVVAEFNISTTSVETGETGFSIETFFASCSRPQWGAQQSGVSIIINCDVTDPATSGNYTQNMTVTVESVRNVFTFQTIVSGAGTWTSTVAVKNATKSSVNVTLIQTLGNGQYEGTVKLNDSSSTKLQSIWFEIKDFTPTFYTQKYSYTSSENITLYANGIVNSKNIAVNLSNATANGGSPEIVVYRYDKSSGIKSAVSGVSIVTSMNQTTPFPQNNTYINLSKSGGWDEGDYEVVANITKVDSAGAPTGAKVNVKTYFSIRLFDVSGWAPLWSNYPKNNVSLQLRVAPSGSYFQLYSGVVQANVTAITNTQTGIALTAGTHYNVSNHTATPSSVGNLNLTIGPLGSGLPEGTYRASVSVTDNVSAKVVTTDIWFEVKAFQFNAYVTRNQYASTDDVVIHFSYYSPSGAAVTLSKVNITSLTRCTTTCSAIDVSTLNINVSFATNRLSILNTTNLASGQYKATLLANDTNGVSATGNTGFQISGFGVSGYIQYPSASGGRYSYFINESMILNVTGTIGTNITNATFKYWECAGTCIEKRFNITIGRVIAEKNELINMSPPGLNGTWLTGPYGQGMFDNIEITAKKGNDSTIFYTFASVAFPYLWNITSATGSTTAGPSDTIVVNVTVCVDYSCNQKLAGARINVTRVLSQAAWGDLNSTAGSWNHTGALTNSNGFAQVGLSPNTTKFNWTVGSIAVHYTATFGNATTYGTYYATVSQKTLTILGKSLKNTTAPPDAIPNNRTLITAPNCPALCWYNLTVSINNPESTAATSDITVTTTRLNSTATINNQTKGVLTAQSIPAGASPTFNFTYNVTGVTNVTHNIQFTPSTSGFASASTTLTYASA